MAIDRRAFLETAAASIGLVAARSRALAQSSGQIPGPPGEPTVMPIDITSRRFVPTLRELGYDVRYRQYDGRHQLPPDSARHAFEWFTST